MNIARTSGMVRSARIPVAIFFALALAAGAVLLSVRPVHALINGGCAATATGSVTGQVDLTTVTDWHVVNQDVVRGHGNAPGGRTLAGATVQLELFGIPYTILSNSKTATTGSAGPYSVSDYSWFARVWGATGSAGGGTCTGSIKITVTNVPVLGTVAGGGGLAAGLLGLIVVVVTLFSKGVAGARWGGALAGLVSATGFGLLLQQTGTLDPTSLADLVIPAIGLLAGALLPGALARSRQA
jgi:hypothetical protein